MFLCEKSFLLRKLPSQIKTVKYRMILKLKRKFCCRHSKYPSEWICFFLRTFKSSEIKRSVRADKQGLTQTHLAITLLIYLQLIWKRWENIIQTTLTVFLHGASGPVSIFFAAFLFFILPFHWHEKHHSVLERNVSFVFSVAQLSIYFTIHKQVLFQTAGKYVLYFRFPHFLMHVNFFKRHWRRNRKLTHIQITNNLKFSTYIWASPTLKLTQSLCRYLKPWRAAFMWDVFKLSAACFKKQLWLTKYIYLKYKLNEFKRQLQQNIFGNSRYV